MLTYLRNGQLCADLVAGISRDQFKERLIEELQFTPSSSSRSTPMNNPRSDASPNVQSQLEERRQRLEADEKRKDAEEKAQRKAKAQARRDEAETVIPDSSRAKQVNYAQQQRKRQQEARQERERILKVIESDRIERKHRDELRKELVRSEVTSNDGANGLIDAQLFKESSFPRPLTSNMCAVQIRLLDGGTIRSRFPSDQSLRAHVRPWIDMERPDGDNTPYTLKHVLTPMPNRPITISEEEESLQALGLTPSATLIMIPVQGYTNAYSRNPSIIMRGLSAGYSVLSDGLAVVSGALGTFLGNAQATANPAYGGTLQQDPRDPSQGPSEASAAGINIRMLRDQHTNRDEHQLYNGNQVILASGHHTIS